MESNENVNGTVAEQQEGTTKTFTQEEVNGIIQSRLAQMKKQAGKEGNAELDQRLKDIEAREMKLLVREKLHEKGMPAELAEVLTCSSAEDLEEKLNTINKIYGKKEEEPKTEGFKIGAGGKDEGHQYTDPVRDAFGLNR